MYQPQHYNSSLGTSGHRATSSINYLSSFDAESKKTLPTSSHYLPPPSSAQQPLAVHLQPTMVGIVPPPLAIPNVQPQHISMMNVPVVNYQNYNYNYNYSQGYQYPPKYQQSQPQAPQEQPATGGINPVLEYDLSHMSTFLSWCAFGMLKQNRNPTKDFESLVHSVLFATRLPKSTIIIALEYMNQRFLAKSLDAMSESDIFVKLIVSLILGNKFNDDNTFTNRSWCGATGLQIELLNEEEKSWLQEVNWQLNVVNFEANIVTLEDCWKTWLDKYTKDEASACSPMSVANPSLPSLPVSSDYSAYYPSSSPTLPYSKSSPIKYQDLMWSQNVPNVTLQTLYHQNSIWSHTPNYQYAPNTNGLSISHQPIQYLNSNFVGYANPYYTFNMASC